MANIEEAIRRLKYLYEVHGAEDVAAAQRAITSSTETTEKASLSLEKSFNNLERRYVSTVKAQQDYQSVQEKVNAAVKQNPALMERGNVVLANAAKQYVTLAKGSELARYEMINLGRQFQDVAVSLGSGQSPFTVLLQQGTQIADVFATSSGTVMGFFRQVGAAALGFATSTAGVVTGVLAVGAAVAYSAASFASAQREIGKALSGIGAASGVTKDQINAIGEASSSAFGISTSEAREAATAFASTGNIYAANVAQATRLVNDYAKTGIDAATASKKLAEALADPAAGALEFNKGLGFLNATTLNYIRSLQAQGREQEAQAALMDSMTPKIQEQSKYTGFLAMAWNAVANAVSNANTAVGKSTTTGGGGTAATLAAGTPAGPSQDVMRAQEEQINRMRAAYQGLATEGTAALNKLSLQADASARAFLPMQGEIEKTQALLAKLQQYKEVTGSTENDAAIMVGKVRNQQLEEQNALIQRQALYIQGLAEKYPGITIETAKQLEIQNAQLGVANARTQAELDVAEQILAQVKYLQQGVGLEEQATLEAGKRAIKEAEVRKQAGVYYSQNQSDETNAANARADAYQDETAQLGHIGSAIDSNTSAMQRHGAAVHNVISLYTEMGITIAGALARSRSYLESQVGPSDNGPIEGFSDQAYQAYQHKVALERVYGAENVEPVTRDMGGPGGQYTDYQLKAGYKAPSIYDPLYKVPELNQSISNLTKSTDSLNETMQNALSPFYSQDPRTTKLGFRAGTVGNQDWMTGAGNANPLVAVLGSGATAPGMAGGGSFTVGGGYSANDNRMAVFPVASGEEIVVNRNREGRGGQVVHIDNRIIVTGTVDNDALGKMKVSRYQQAQRMRSGLTRA